jgi:hypothetical protein
MFVLRSLFWIAVVALLMPRAPDLGLEFASPSGLPSVHVLRGAAAADMRRQTDLRDFIDAYRTAAFGRLVAVRADLAANATPAGPSYGLSDLVPDDLGERILTLVSPRRIKARMRLEFPEQFGERATDYSRHRF